MVYKLIFIIDLGNMQNIKMLADDPSSLSCMMCLFTYLYVRYQSLRDDHPSVGCTCPYGSNWLLASLCIT